ncbi:ABC transporter ATP-binding protein [candidate division KSB1 bacterium]
MKNTVIQLENVSKIYQMGNVKVPALRDINLKIKKGSFMAIAGPSGSGKSTMMNMVGALDIPSEGAIYLKDKDIASMGESSLAVLRGQTIGFVFQQFNLIPTLTALENVMLPMEFIEMEPALIKKRARQLLEMLGLEDRIYHKPAELSGGQQQRVAIARSLSNNPEIILADEPTGNLDSKTGKFVMDFLGKLNKKENKTIILVTHDMHLVKYAKRIVYLKDGMIIKDTKNGG